MRICIAGVGAIGGVVAGYLLDAGQHEISLLARGKQLAAIKKDGLRVHSRGKTIVGHPSLGHLRSSDSGADLGVQDAIIVAAKAYSLAGISPALKPMIGPNTVVVTAQNGIPWWYFYGLDSHGIQAAENNTPFETVDPNGTVWQTIGPEHAVGCIINLPAERQEPGVIHHSSNGAKVTIGAPKKGDHPAQLTALNDAFNGAGMECVVADDIRLATWVKLQSQVASAPLAVLTGGNNKEVATAPGLDAIKERVSAEAIAVAQAWKVPIKANPDRQTTGATNHKSSILQDFEAGRPLELDAMIGSVIELGRRRGIATPTIEMLYSLTRLRAETRRKP
jgi:2-dehydropantoate 2-reductase